MSISMRWKYGLTMMVALGMPVTALAEEPRPELEAYLYEQFLEELDQAGIVPVSPPAPAVPTLRSGAVMQQSASASSTGTMKCLPTCGIDDGRFLAIASQNLITLSEAELNLEISVPSGTTSFQVGIFDGDGRELDSAGVSHWDSGFQALYEYRLFADPTASGTGAVPIELSPGFPVVLSSSMPDNSWIDFDIATDPAALTPSGNYFYRLNIRLASPSIVTLNAFKIRTSALLSGFTLDPVARPFSYIVNTGGLADLRTIYPSFPATTPTTYDGTVSFFFELSTSQREMVLWDGDFDRGKYDGTDRDTDDPDTPNAPFLPDWSTIDTVSEGVAVGALGTTSNPPDDRSPAGNSVYSLRSPSIRYDVTFPDGRTFSNENPSGNQEWEQFRISTEVFDPSSMDHSTPDVPPGVYQLRATGVDLANLNALLLPYRLVCVDELGAPCQLLRPFLIGKTVFYDRDGDGIQDAEESGLAGISVELVDSFGVILATAASDSDGLFTFPVEAGTYEIRIAASNYGSGQALDGYISTTGDRQTGTVIDDNVMTLAFGYRGTSSLGDRVWSDTNGNGLQEAGETGLNGVTAELLDAEGTIAATVITSSDGNYTFTSLPPGIYTVRLDSATLPLNIAATFDADGTATLHLAQVTLTAGSPRTDADFGYAPRPQPGTGTIGYWKNHPEAWPVEQIIIGSMLYTKAQAITLMKSPGKGDKTYNMFHQLVAARLNVLIGNDASCISGTIAGADAWLVSSPLGSNVKGGSAVWRTGEPLHRRLDDYNNGKLCAPHRG